jgi:hypothetical protein
VKRGSAAMSSEWYVDLDGNKVGPVSWRRLRQWAEQGRVTAGTVVRKGRTGPWMLATEVTGLLRRFRPEGTADNSPGRKPWGRVLPNERQAPAGATRGLQPLSLCRPLRGSPDLATGAPGLTPWAIGFRPCRGESLDFGRGQSPTNLRSVPRSAKTGTACALRRLRHTACAYYSTSADDSGTNSAVMRWPG